MTLLIFLIEAGFLAVIGVAYFTAMQRAPKLMDSPWLWGMIFSGVALNNVILMDAKYEKREAGVELRYLVRERAVPNGSPEVNGGNGPSAEELHQDAKLAGAKLADGGQTPPTGLIVPHGFLIALVGAFFLFSGVRLYRQIARAKLDSREASQNEGATGSAGRRN